jgi:hypothetical protein
MPDVKIHDFRVVDRVLGETEPDAGDIVYLGARGTIAYPFLAMRRLSGPGGVYIDAVDILDADGASLATLERRFELDGESKPREVVTEFRDVRFPQPGTYVAQYSIYDDVVANFPFTVLQDDSPATGIVPGPLDAALGKSTILWLSLGDPSAPGPSETGRPTKQPKYSAGREFAVWYGYEEGRIYVLTGEGEQPVPGLLGAPSVRVVARSKDRQSLVADVECSVEILAKDARWDAIARDLLVGRRLNLRDGDGAIDRWRKTCEIAMLVPLPPARA